MIEINLLPKNLYREIAYAANDPTTILTKVQENATITEFNPLVKKLEPLRKRADL